MDTPAERLAYDVWAYGSNDHVWEAIFDLPRSKFYDEYQDEDFDYIDVAAELFEKIQFTPDFTVGDLTHEQVIEQILRRYPLLGPSPFG